jgi:hypothetical protein
MPKRPSSEAGEPCIGVGAGLACRLAASTGGVASGAGREMDRSGDEVRRMSSFSLTKKWGGADTENVTLLTLLLLPVWASICDAS